MTNQMSDRANVRDAVRAIADRPHAQVLIIGGGINGLSTFRDLARQGIDVTVVDRGDWCSGASSASSHMIHGGIRYLENGEFRLVRESVHERNSLVKIAPHYVKPLETTVPIFSTFSGILSAPLRFLTHKQGKPNERGALLIKTGLMIYDAFSRDGGSVPRHTFRRRKKSLQAHPKLNRDLKYTATYYDASVHDPERLALDVLHDGLASGPNARAANYLEATASEDGAVTLTDQVSGESFDMTADVVVNASGPWTDLTNRALGQETAYMGGTKGSHIVLDSPELLEATAGNEIFFEHSDGRIVLIYPLKGRVMVGTTDIDADPSQPVRCTEEEVDYFFDLVKHVFPAVNVDRSQIVYRFSGIRPLPGHGDTQPGFVSRDYRVVQGELGGTPLLSLVGGKLTTFRALGEQLGDKVLEVLGQSRTSSTDGQPIGGGRGYPTTDAARTTWLAAHADTVPRSRAKALLERYGTRAEAVIDELSAAGDTPLHGAPDYSREELAYLVRTEQVSHLIDVLKRRTSLAFTGAVTDAVLDEVASVAASVLGWDAETEARERDDAARVLREENGVTLNGRKESPTLA